MIFFKYFVRMLILLAVFLTLSIKLLQSTSSNVQAATVKDSKTLPFTPSPDPKRGIFFWRLGGFSTQPIPYKSITVGDTYRLDTNVVRPPKLSIDSLDFPHYYWLKSTDNEHWDYISKKYSTKSYLDVSPTEAGTTWYQAHVEYTGLIGVMISDSFDSQISAIDAQPKSISANSISIDIGTDYLFNSGNELTPTSTLASYKLDPHDSTELVNWESDDHSLATVDQNGLITANTNNKSGDVTITGTVKNEFGENVSDSKTIHIGGGLVEQKTVHAGESATFELRTGSSETRDTDEDFTVEWHEINKITHKDHIVQPDNDQLQKIAYTKHDPTTKDDGNLYYAVITVKGKKKQSFVTNKAILQVLPSPIPNVDVKSQVVNTIFTDPNNTTNTIKNVITADQLTYHLSVNNSSGKPIKNSYLALPLNNQTIIDNIKMNGKPIDPNDYNIIYTDDKKELKIRVDNLDSLEHKTFDITTMMDDINHRQSITSVPHYFGEDYQGNLYQNDGPALRIDCINNKLNTEFRDINFEPIMPLDLNTTKYRADDNNEIVTVDDQRRKKNPVKIFLRQDTPFHNENGNLDVSLEYHKHGTARSIFGQLISVAETHLNETVHSIVWKKHDGLILHVNNSKLVPGAYSSSLSWYVEESV